MKKFLLYPFLLSCLIYFPAFAFASPLRVLSVQSLVSTGNRISDFSTTESCTDHGYAWPADRTYLGVKSVPDDQGARIVDIMDNSPAQKAGLQKDDIITNVDGKQIDGPEKLAEVVTSLKADQKVKVTYLRDGKKKTVSVVLGLMPDNMQGFRDFGQIAPSEPRPFVVPQPYSMPYPRQWQEAPTDPRRYRAPFMPNPYQRLPYMTIPRIQKPELGLQIQDSENDSGVTVLEVRPGTPAAEAGILKGDLIKTVNGANVRNVPETIGEINKAKGSDYTLEIVRGGKKIAVTVKTKKVLRKADI